MQKRKFKVNILDITIVILIICAALALVFRETINDFFTKPEIKVLELTVTAEVTDDNQKALFTLGNTVDIGVDGNVKAVVRSATIADNKVTAVIACNGYKRLGRFFAENGSPLSVGTAYKLLFGSNTVVCNIKSIDLPI